MEEHTDTLQRWSVDMRPLTENPYMVVLRIPEGQQVPQKEHREHREEINQLPSLN